MQAKQLLVLAVAAVIAIAVAIYLQSPGQRQTFAEKTLLVPGMSDNINAITQVRLKKAGDETVATLKLGDEGWTLAERHDYRADAGKIRKLLLQLSEALVVEQKTSNPELYAKLGVEEITSNDAAGVQVEIDGLELPVAIILGQAAATLEATYARPAGDQQSILISGQLQPDAETGDWLNRALVDIAGDRVQRVHITRPDGDNLEASRAARGDSLEVKNVPQGRGLTSASAASGLGTALSGLELDDVMPDSMLDTESSEWITSQFVTFDGLALEVRAVETNEDYYVMLGASFDEEQARSHYKPSASAEETAADAPAGGEGISEPAQAEIDPQTFTQAQSEVEELQSSLEGWAFKIPSFKYDNLTTSLSSLLKEEE